MSADAAAGTPRARRIVCARCAREFGCVLDGPCWCGREEFRLPLPERLPEAGGADCLCPDCLRAHAIELRAAAEGSAR